MTDIEIKKLESLNQLRLTNDERVEVIALFDKLFSSFAIFDKIDISSVERMVHVMPNNNVLREDVVIKQFSREQLQKDAPDIDEGYWCVPRVVE